MRVADVQSFVRVGGRGVAGRAGGVGREVRYAITEKVRVGMVEGRREGEVMEASVRNEASLLERVGREGRTG